MSKVNAAAGGGRLVEVEAARLTGWLDRFARRHGGIEQTEMSATRVTVTATDMATAVIMVPFGPLSVDHDGGDGGFVRWPGLVIDPVLVHLHKPRRIGLVLVRLGGHSVGVAQSGRVLASTTDRRLMHGWNAAGG